MENWRSWTVAALAVLAISLPLLLRSVHLIPDLAEMRSEEATDVLSESGFRIGEVVVVDSAESPSGDWVVITQSPVAGRVGFNGLPVTLTVAELSSKVPVPAVSGLLLRDALERVEAAELNLLESIQTPAWGVVISQYPAPGSLVARGGNMRAEVFVPHQQDHPDPWEDFGPIHGAYYLYYGYGTGECASCHNGDACTASGCHSEEAFDALSQLTSGGPDEIRVPAQRPRWAF